MQKRIICSIFTVVLLLFGLIVNRSQINAAPLFSDDFNDAKADGWVVQYGSWSVVSEGSEPHVYYQSGIAGDGRAAAGSSAWTDYSVEADVKIKNFNGAKRALVCARYKDGNNYYAAGLYNNNGGKLEIRKKVGGRSTTLVSKSYPLASNVWYKVKLQVKGSNIKMYVNGNLQLSTVDNTMSSGRIGLITNGVAAMYDNINVLTLSSGTAETATVRVTAPATSQAAATVGATSLATPRATTTARVTSTATPRATVTGTYNLVVAKNGSGDYTTVQAAINAAPSNNRNWFTIYIKNGTYQEIITVPAGKNYLRLLGESKTGTKLVYHNCSSTAGGTAASSSAFFKADNFIAQNLTFENSFDYDNSTLANKQAVAAEPLADRQVFINCRFIGNQDTLYVQSGRQYFKNCYIEGHTDFIFGNATAVFDQCEIHSLYKPGACISAPSTLATTTYGLVFLNCTVNGDSRLNAKSVHLGRPWHPGGNSNVKSSAVYLYCKLGPHIKTEGWTSMSGVSPSTERFYEYQNSGAGAAVNSSRRQLSASQAANYTVLNILKGKDNWNPTTLP